MKGYPKFLPLPTNNMRGLQLSYPPSSPIRRRPQIGLHPFNTSPVPPIDQTPLPS